MVALLAGITSHAYLKLERKEPVNRLFLALLAITESLLFLEILSVLLDSPRHVNFLTFHKLVNVLGFTLAPVAPVLGILYVYKRAHKYQRINWKKFIWLGVPLAVNGILAVGSYQYPWIFHITPGNIYVRGPLFVMAPLTSYFYGGVYLFFLYHHRAKLFFEEQLIFGLLAVFPASLAIFQLFYPIFLTIWNSMAIVLIINYIYILHCRIKIDPLTGLSNRVVYNEYFAGFHKNRNVALAVVNIDLDDFKSINDTWGHHEGDKVLRFFARLLEEVFGEKGIPIRWGGDEFIVLVKEKQQEVLEQYLQTLVARIETWNENSGLPYRIRFSYGMTVFDTTYQSMDEIIRHSDKLMYEAKQKKETPGH